VSDKEARSMRALHDQQAGGTALVVHPRL